MNQIFLPCLSFTTCLVELPIALSNVSSGNCNINWHVMYKNIVRATYATSQRRLEFFRDIVGHVALYPITSIHILVSYKFCEPLNHVIGNKNISINMPPPVKSGLCCFFCLKLWNSIFLYVTVGTSVFSNVYLFTPKLTLPTMNVTLHCTLYFQSLTNLHHNIVSYTWTSFLTEAKALEIELVCNHKTSPLFRLSFQDAKCSLLFAYFISTYLLHSFQNLHTKFRSCLLCLVTNAVSSVSKCISYTI